MPISCSDGRPIVITGASGLLGSNLVFELARRQHPIVALCNSHPVNIPGVISEVRDLTRSFDIRELLSTLRPGLIIHCAAATNVDWCEKNSALCSLINTEVPAHLATQAHRAGAGFVYISTDSVFNGLTGGYIERDQVSPVNAYGRSKADGEVAVLAAMSAALVLRVNIYGWNLQSKQSLSEWALGKLERNQQVPGFTDTTFSPVLVNDIAQWILDFRERGYQGICHLASRDHCTKFDFARYLAETFGLPASLVAESRMSDSALTSPRPLNTWLRADMAESILRHTMPAIAEGLSRFRALRDQGFVKLLKLAGMPRI